MEMGNFVNYVNVALMLVRSPIQLAKLHMPRLGGGRKPNSNSTVPEASESVASVATKAKVCTNFYI